jgi:hypothetical protein
MRKLLWLERTAFGEGAAVRLRVSRILQAEWSRSGMHLKHEGWRLRTMRCGCSNGHSLQYWHRFPLSRLLSTLGYLSRVRSAGSSTGYILYLYL